MFTLMSRQLMARLTRFCPLTCWLVASGLLVAGWSSPLWAGQGACGQPQTTGTKPAATDALFVLRSAVGLQTCDVCVCDVNNDERISAVDALLVLKFAVGLPVTLDCPPCTTTTTLAGGTTTTSVPVTTSSTTLPGQQICEDLLAPTCGGSCPSGETCGPDPFQPQFCGCFTGCELDSPPSCGGDCGDQPDVTCQVLTLSAGGEVMDLCDCIKPGLKACADSATTDCDGACSPGGICASDGAGGCVCQSLPLQGACAKAASPQCGGTCSEGTICENTTDGCSCVTARGGDSCLDAQYPTCGGACPDGELCAADTLGDCECFAPCELGQAPTCGGDCLDPTDTCIPATGTVAGATVAFCLCE